MEVGGSAQPGPGATEMVSVPLWSGMVLPASHWLQLWPGRVDSWSRDPPCGVGAMPLQVATEAEGVPGMPGDSLVWASSLLSNRQLGEEQWLQISKELADLEVATHSLREQHEAEVFQLRSEVGGSCAHGSLLHLGDDVSLCHSHVPAGPSAGGPGARAGAAWKPRQPGLCSPSHSQPAHSPGAWTC